MNVDDAGTLDTDLGESEALFDAYLREVELASLVEVAAAPRFYAPAPAPLTLVINR